MSFAKLMVFKIVFLIFLLNIIGCAAKDFYTQLPKNKVVNLPDGVQLSSSDTVRLPDINPIVEEYFVEIPSSPPISLPSKEVSRGGYKGIYIDINTDGQPCLKIYGNKRKIFQQVLSAINSLGITNQIVRQFKRTYLLTNTNKLLVHSSSNAVYLTVKSQENEYVLASTAKLLLQSLKEEIAAY